MVRVKASWANSNCPARPQTAEVPESRSEHDGPIGRGRRTSLRKEKSRQKCGPAGNSSVPSSPAPRAPDPVRDRRPHWTQSTERAPDAEKRPGPWASSNFLCAQRKSAPRGSDGRGTAAAKPGGVRGAKQSQFISIVQALTRMRLMVPLAVKWLPGTVGVGAGMKRVVASVTSKL